MDNNTPQTQNEAPASEKSKLIRNILIGAIIFTVIIGIFLVAYRYFNKDEGTTEAPLFPIVDNIIDSITGNKDGDGKGSDLDKVLTDQTRIVELYKGPIAGYTLLEESDAVRVFDRTKGLIFDINLISGETKAVTDQPILKVHDALFVGQNNIITRSLNESGIIKSNLYEFSKDDSGEILRLIDKPSFLSDNILELSKSQNDKYVAFVIKDPKGSNIDLYNVETQKLTRLISLPVSEWIPSVTNDGDVYISMKASKYADSGTYKISNENLKIIKSAKTAQTSVLSPDGQNLLSTAIYNNEFLSSIVKTDKSIADMAAGEDLAPSLFTLADKCTWNESGTTVYCGVPRKFGLNTPDEWYLGNISYEDNIWEYNLNTKKTGLILESMSNKVSIDIVDMRNFGNTLYFKNKKDGHLWGYRLIQREETNTETNSDATAEDEQMIDNEENQ